MKKTQQKQQPKKQYTSGAVVKLHKKHAELGFKEVSPLKNYYGFASDAQGKLHVMDALQARYRTEAVKAFEQESKLKGWKLVEVRAYQQ